MKFIRYPWVFTGAVALGMAAAACSSKSNDEGAGGAGQANGGVSNGGATTTGGMANSGGQASNSVAGSTAFDQNSYCNGLFKGKSCSQTQVEADVKTVNMLLVLDESGSMDQPPVAGSTGGPTKWTIMKSALQTALTQVQDQIDFGLLLFPYLESGIPADSNNPAETCAVPTDVTSAINVPIGMGAGAVQEVLTKVNGQTPAGGTPTARALKQAYNYFTTGDGRNLPGTKWVLLATDGGPNCNTGLTCDADTCTQNIDHQCGSGLNCCSNAGYICLDDAAVTTQIKSLALVGVRTFVIGIPGSDAYSASLNTFANAGLMPNKDGLNGETYYAISSTSAQQDLVDAFGTITTQLIKSCDIPLKVSPPDPNKVTVAIDCNPVPAITAGSATDAGADGYYVDYTYNPNPAHIKLVGSTCDSISAQGAHHVDVIVGCQGIK